MLFSLRPFKRIVAIAIPCVILGVLPAFAQQNTYVVQAGDSLFRIAQNYGLSVNDLAAANNIVNTWQIFAGQTLVIPSATAPDPVFQTIDPTSLLPVDPITGAPSFPISQLSAETLIESAPAPVEVAAAPTTVNTSYHTIQRGETLASIASQYGLTSDQLAAQNNISNPNLIYAGQQLIVGTVATAVMEVPVQPVEVNSVPPVVSNIPTENVYHLVQPGEHLAQIASRYGVSWTAIASVNNIYNPNQVFAGQELIIPFSASAELNNGINLVAAAPPAPTGIGREILVDLSDSRIYAYENGVLLRNVLVSTGLPATPTVLGDYTVQRKYVSSPMSGPGYYLPDVPYSMYFFEGYAIHGTYWHSNFGQPMSHGCVNLPTPEAEWFYNFAPIGTPVRVQP